MSEEKPGREETGGRSASGRTASGRTASGRTASGRTTTSRTTTGRTTGSTTTGRTGGRSTSRSRVVVGRSRGGTRTGRNTVVAGQSSLTATRTTTRNVRADLFPTSVELVDVAVVILLGLIALYGFEDTFTGHSYLVVGGIGLVLGALVSRLTQALRWPFAAAALISTALFFLLGGALTLRSLGDAAVVPGASTARELSERAVHGWKEMLTTLPPVDGHGPLLVLPWVLGLATGAVCVALAGARFRWPWLRALAPIVVEVALLGLVLALGVSHPVSVLVQGTVFAAVALAWMTWRARSAEPLVRGAGFSPSQAVAGAVLLGLAGAVAWPLGTSVADPQRLVLRQEVDPPFLVSQYPSPLSSFRRYVDPLDQKIETNLHDTELFTVKGVAPGTRMRFATLDRYDGIVWGAADVSGAAAVPADDQNTFQRVSGTIDNPVPGASTRVEVTLGQGWSGVWLPVAGALRSITFATGAPHAKEESFRYNLSTSTAVVPAGLHPGDTYRFTAAVRPADADVVTETTPASTNPTTVADGLGFLDQPAETWSGEASTPMQRVFAIAAHLRNNGRYSDGVKPSERSYTAGHSLARLDPSMVRGTPVGNDEQYAALMALLANRVGVPARVVMGAVVPESGTVKGAEVHAWVEVQRADGSWGTLPPSVYQPTRRPDEQQEIKREEQVGTIVPPPAPIPPPSVTDDQSETALQRKQAEREDVVGPGPGLPAWVRWTLIGVGGPLAILLAVVALLVGAKAWRRARRRKAPHPSTRFAGGWDEIVDTARDLGMTVPMGGSVTRREQGAVIDAAAAERAATRAATKAAKAQPAAPALPAEPKAPTEPEPLPALLLAKRADAQVFGPNRPDEQHAAEYWARVDATRAALRSGEGRLRRGWAAVNPSGLSPRRLRRNGGAGYPSPTEWIVLGAERVAAGARSLARRVARRPQGEEPAPS